MHRIRKITKCDIHFKVLILYYRYSKNLIFYNSIQILFYVIKNAYTLHAQPLKYVESTAGYVA